MTIDLITMGKSAKQAARILNRLTTQQKNNILQAIANQLRKNESQILKANQEDMEMARKMDISTAMLDRLLLTAERLENIASDVEHVISLEDPVGQQIEERTLPNGLSLQRQRTPLGVVGVIYEARPNVTIDVATLCLKSGNAVILRGGKETLLTNKVLATTIQEALTQSQAPPTAVQLITDPDRALVSQFLKLDQYIDMIIPRGGEKLHQLCKEQSTIPVITGGIGVCHMYVSESALVEESISVIHNAKVQRPTVCNALDTLLIHQSMATRLLPLLLTSLSSSNVEVRADQRAYEMIEGEHSVQLATDNDWGVEFLSLVLSVRIVESLDQALEHIAIHSSGHSDAILTTDKDEANRFLNEVDSACVYVNASTRFTDGAQFGLGAEVAVSTQKLHARGPMALEGLTTYKWLIRGDWHFRK